VSHKIPTQRGQLNLSLTFVNYPPICQVQFILLNDQKSELKLLI